MISIPIPISISIAASLEENTAEASDMKRAIAESVAGRAEEQSDDDFIPL